MLPRLRIESDGPHAAGCRVYVDDQLVPGVAGVTLTLDPNGRGIDRFAQATLRLLVRIDTVDLPARVSPELLAWMRGSDDEARRLVQLEDEADAAFIAASDTPTETVA